MSAAIDRVARPQPHGRGARPERIKKVLEAPCPFHGGQAKHLLKDCATIRGYIRGTLGQQGKAYKPASKAGEPMDGAQEADAKFPEAKRCLMTYGGSQAPESHRLSA